MALQSYDQVQDSIKRWCWDRNDLPGLIPDAIALCESRLNNTLRVAQMEAEATITLSNGSGPLPSDYIAWRRVVTTDVPARALEFLSPEVATDTYPHGTQSLANFFTIIGSTIKTYPSSSNNLSLVYYQKIPALSVSITGNWVTSRVPALYIYGSLLELAVFFDDDERVATWGTLFDRSIKELNSADTMSRYARPVARIKGVTP